MISTPHNYSLTLGLLVAIIATSATPMQGGSTSSAKNTVPGVVEGPKPSLVPDWLDVTVAAEVGATYDDNIFISPKDEEQDVIYNLSPILTIGAGDTETKTENFLTLNYRADFEFFQDNDAENSIENRGSLDAQYRFTKLVLGMRAFVEDLSGAESEFGDRVSRLISSLRLMSLYQVNERFSLELNGEGVDRNYDRSSNVDSFELFGEIWANYQILPKVNLGLGATAGNIDVSSGPDQAFYSPNIKAIYALSEKLSFVLRAGYDIRDFDGAEGNDREEPTFGLTSSWLPFDGTKIELNAYRVVRNSAILSGQNITLTGLILNLEQRVIQKVRLSLRGGYEFSDYTANESTQTATREDEYWLLRLGAVYEPNDWLKVLAYYQFRTNDSTIDPVDFDNNQLSLRVQLSF